MVECSGLTGWVMSKLKTALVGVELFGVPPATGTPLSMLAGPQNEHVPPLASARIATPAMPLPPATARASVMLMVTEAWAALRGASVAAVTARQRRRVRLRIITAGARARHRSGGGPA